MAPAYASMERDSPDVRSVAAPAYASTKSDAADARSVVVPTYAITARNAAAAQNARTYRALWKDVHSSATVFAVPRLC